MISERTFATEFTGFWSECLPFLSSQAIAEINLRGTLIQNDRDELLKPIPRSADTSNNDLIAELGFELFARALSSGSSVADLALDKRLISEIENRAKVRIFGLSLEGTERMPLSELKVKEAVEVARRLYSYFKRNSEGRIVVQPHFKGCGILDSCYGDVLAGNGLYEVKVVDRNLRSVDIRQVLIYCALSRQSEQLEIDNVVVVNPRRGLEFKFDVNELADMAAHKTAGEVFHQITSFLTDFEPLHKAS